jgi:hypothetical protein
MSLHQARSTGMYYGLTWLCHRVRKEFFPLYERNTGIILSMWDLKKFTNTFKASGLLGVFEGQVIVEVSFRGNRNHDKIDILPVIRMRKTTPRLNLTFCLEELSRRMYLCRNIIVVNNANVLLSNMEDHPTWQQWFDKAVWKVTFGPGLRFHVRQDYAESWMGHYDLLIPHYRDHNQWINKVGLPDLCSLYGGHIFLRFRVTWVKRSTTDVQK